MHGLLLPDTTFRPLIRSMAQAPHVHTYRSCHLYMLRARVENAQAYEGHQLQHCQGTPRYGTSLQRHAYETDQVNLCLLATDIVALQEHCSNLPSASYGHVCLLRAAKF